MRGLPALVLLLAGLALASPASAATTIGQVAADPTGLCGPSNGGRLAVQTVAASPGWVVPSAGVITGWSSTGRTAAESPGVQFTVWREAADDPGFYNLIGITEAQTVPMGALGSFPARITTQAGDVIGLYSTTGPAGCFGTGATGDRVARQNYSSIEVAGPINFLYQLSGVSVTPALLNAAAVLEPDADADGFGDETQDLCATDATIQTACPVAEQPPENNETTTPPASQPDPVVTPPAGSGPPPAIPVVPAFAVAAARKATFKVTVPAAGRLSWRGKSGRKVVIAGSRAVQAGTPGVTVTLNAAGRKLLKKKSRLTVPVVFTFTPAAGAAVTRTRPVTFKR